MGPEQSNLTLKEDILKGAEYFYCEKLYCRLKIDVCLQRQQANLKRRKFAPIPFLSCQNCGQGTENLLFQKSGGNMPQEKPSRGNGERNINCEKYDKCLDVAAKKDWKTFNCEKCPFFTDQKQTPKPPKIENKRICESCGERPTMQASSPYCSRCLTDMKRAKQNADNAPKKKNEGTNKPKTVTAKKTANTTVTLDFGKYVLVLKEVEELAAKKMRTVDMQIAYMLNNQLKARQKMI